jgi:hypothetical protein
MLARMFANEELNMLPSSQDETGAYLIDRFSFDTFVGGPKVIKIVSIKIVSFIWVPFHIEVHLLCKMTK